MNCILQMPDPGCPISMFVSCEYNIFAGASLHTCASKDASTGFKKNHHNVFILSESSTKYFF